MIEKQQYRGLKGIGKNALELLYQESWYEREVTAGGASRWEKGDEGRLGSPR